MLSLIGRSLFGIANLAAAVVVEKLNQTGTAAPDKILTRYELTQEMDKVELYRPDPLRPGV